MNRLRKGKRPKKGKIEKSQKFVFPGEERDVSTPVKKK
jgi:hypothetical protein